MTIDVNVVRREKANNNRGSVPLERAAALVERVLSKQVNRYVVTFELNALI